MNYDPKFMVQELGKFNFKINVVLNELEKYMSLNGTINLSISWSSYENNMLKISH